MIPLPASRIRGGNNRRAPLKTAALPGPSPMPSIIRQKQKLQNPVTSEWPAAAKDQATVLTINSFRTPTRSIHAPPKTLLNI